MLNDCRCGETPKIKKQNGSPYIPTHYWVACGKCGANSFANEVKDKAITAWNTRANEQQGGE